MVGKYFEMPPSALTKGKNSRKYGAPLGWPEFQVDGPTVGTCSFDSVSKTS
jgi:hypothetical protein